MPDRETKHANSEHLPGVKRQQSSNISSSEASLCTRRRLVKAMSITLPAVMTLYHGAVLALSSSATRCLEAREFGQDNSGLLEIGTNRHEALSSTYEVSSEQTVCREVTIRQYKFDDSITSKNPFLPEVINFYQDHHAGQVWRYEDSSSTGSYTEQDLDAHVKENWGEFSAVGNTNSSSGMMGKRLCAIAQVDNFGSLRRYGDPNGWVMPVSQSCWVSVHPNG